MKRLFIAFFLVSFIDPAYSGGGKVIQDEPIPYPRSTVPYELGLLKAPDPIVASRTSSGGSWGDTLFQTSYDVQTNASMQNRVFISSNGDVSVVATTDEPGGGGGPNRNIGFIRRDNTAGTWLPAEYPIRSNRSGWPSLASDDNNDRIFSHTPQYMNHRTTPGTGTWLEDTTVQILGGTFSNSFGAVGNYVHHVIPGAVNGKAGFLYSRSTNGGTTWDKIGDTTVFFLSDTLWTEGDGEGVWAEGINLIQRGSTVAITTGGQGSLMMFKSNDNGNTWNVTRVATLDTAGVIRDVDQAGNEINYCFDNTFSTSIDQNGMVHIAGAMSAYASNPNHYNWLGYYPIIGKGLAYWNESYGHDYNTLDSNDWNNLVLLTYVDENGDGKDGTPNTLDSIGDYYTHGPISCPSISLGDNGEVVISFTSVREDLTGLGVIIDGNDGKKGPGSDINAIASFDGGNTWHSPRNVCDEINGTVAASWVEEDYYLSSWPWIVAGNAHIVWQSDDYLDAQWNSTTPGIVQSHIVYYPIDMCNVCDGTSPGLNKDLSIRGYPNPATKYFKIEFEMVKRGEGEILILDNLGNLLERHLAEFDQGKANYKIDVSGMVPGIYICKVNGSNYSGSTKFLIR